MYGGNPIGTKEQLISQIYQLGAGFIDETCPICMTAFS